MFSDLKAECRKVVEQVAVSIDVKYCLRRHISFDCHPQVGW